MKKLFVWDESYSVGVEEIDKQHQKMLEIINRLYGLLAKFDVAGELSGVINEIMEYADYHFSTEEKYFKDFNYEETEEHIRLHNEYRKKVNDFFSDYKKGSLALSFDVLDYLEDWWLGHIHNIDKRYTQCFHEHGLY